MKNLLGYLNQLLIFVLIIALSILNVPINGAEIVVDKNTPIEQRPTIDKAPNGVPVINLAKTTNKGVSYNKFETYNVTTQGLILNNSLNMGTSVLGGVVYGNPNYQSNGTEARIVINEVTGSNRSNIFGTTEMFGKSAELVIVNPNGILLNGAGFINIPRVTLGTGLPVFNEDDFKGINIGAGKITVEDAGIDAGEVNYFEILARAVELYGNIKGNDVRINTGIGYYDYFTKNFTQGNTVLDDKIEFGIDASLFGSIYAGRITLISNEYGVGVRSEGDLLADVSDIVISADGKVELKNVNAAKDIYVDSNESITQMGDSFALGNINYRGSGLTNRGAIKAVDDINLSGLLDNRYGDITGGSIYLNTDARIDNISGRIISNKDTGILEIKGLDNLTIDGGEIKSAGILNINAGGDLRLNNNITSIYGYNGINLSSANLFNNTKIDSNGHVVIDLSGSLNIGAGGWILSNKGIDIDADCEIINSGKIGGGSVNIRGANLLNDTGSEITGGQGAASNIDITGSITNRSRISSRNNLTVIGNNIINENNMSEISTGGSLNLTGNNISNNGGLIYSSDNMNINMLSLRNTEGYIYTERDMNISGASIVNELYNYLGNIESDGNMYIDLGAGTLENIGIDYGSYTTKWDEVGSRGSGSWNKMYEDVIISEMRTDPSYILSGGDINIITGSLLNHGSVISADKNITIDADKVINETNGVNVTLESLWGKRVAYKKKIGPFKYGTGHKNYDEYRYTPEMALSVDEAMIQAGGTVTINAGSLDNGNAKIEENSSTGVKGATGNLVYNSSVIENIAQTGAIDLTQYIRLDGNGNALFNINKDTDVKYLIETRLEYIDLDKFKGSEYLLGRIGYNPEGEIKFLGDAYYEQKLISEAIMRSTDRRYLYDLIASETAQMEWLLENAVSAHRDLQLAVGVELTKEQINELQQPIVWYVFQEVMGVVVLTPKIYIPEHIIEGFQVDSGSTIAGDIVKINTMNQTSANGIDNNDARITDVYNSGSIRGRSVVDIQAENDILNSGGTISAGNLVSLHTDKGDIINETNVYTKEYNLGGYVESTLGKTGTIESGGNLIINSGGNILNRGADVKAEGDAVLAATGNIDFETVHLKNRGYDKQDGTSGVSNTTSVSGSNLGVGGDLNIISGKDVNLIGSNADIGGAANLDVAGNFNILNDYETSRYEGTKTSSNLINSTKTTVVKDKTTVAGSSFNVGGDIKGQIDGDFNLVGSELTSGGDANLNIAGTKNVVAVYDEESSKKTKTTSGFAVSGIYGKASSSNTVSDKTAQGSTIDVKGRYSSSSGGDTNIVGSTIKAGEANISAGGDLNIVAAYNEHFEEHTSTKSGIGMGKNIYAMELDIEGKGSQTASGSTISAGKLTLDSNNDILIAGSRIEAGQADITAVGDVKIEAAKETNYEYKIHEEAAIGINNVIDTAVDIHKQTSLALLTGGGSILHEGRASVDIAKGEYEKTENRSDITSQAGSEILTDGDLNIKSGKDITIGASDLKAGGDINLDADGNVKIETRDEVIVETTKETSGEITVSVGIRNTGVDTYIAGKDLKEAKDAYEQGLKSYDKFKEALNKAEEDLNKGLITQDEYDSIKSDEKYYQANIALLAENVASKTAALAEAIAAIPGSTPTLGFSGDIQLNIDGKKTEATTESVNAIGSSILSDGNINIKSGDNTKIEGSIVNAADDVTIDAKNVEIIAGKNTVDSKTTEREIHETIRFDTTGTFNANASGSKTESSFTEESYTNSYIDGNNVTIKSQEDTIVRGGNVEADEKLKLDVGGNLLVESLQDKSKSDSYTIGTSIGGSSNSGNAGVNFNVSKNESNWVNDQTSLTGGSVDIYVENKTTLKGAVIASESGDLKLDTESLEYSDIKDKDRSYSIGGGISLGGNSDGENNNPKYSVDGEYGLRDKRQTNFATVGEGEIIVRDGETDLSGLNRDVSIAQYETKAETGLEGSFRVDDTLVDMTENLIDAIRDPNQALEDLKGMGEKSVDGLAEFAMDAIDVYDGLSEVAEQTKNFVTGDGFLTDEEVKEQTREGQLAKAKENIENLLGDNKSLSNLELIQEFINNGDEAGLKQFLDSPDGKFLAEILSKVNNTLKDIKDFEEDKTKYPKQNNVDCDNPSKACTFTADYIAALLLTSYNILSIDETARLAKKEGITSSNMSVSDNTAIAKLSGAKDVIIANTATYIDTDKKPGAKSSADATADWINIINSGDKLVIRVGQTPGVPEGHSLVIQDYYVNSQGKIEFIVIDPERIYNRYDPQTKQIFKMEGDDRVNDRKKRTIINYLKATKK
ncbi:MAG: hemagglutinin repeat-containing protein [Leptospirales bacterium]|nr:hemagglutinin repeat-containing protein [Leptospirales bacterium]